MIHIFIERGNHGDMKALDTVENVLIVAGIAVSLEQIYTILGIVILAVQIILIITKTVIKVIEYVKTKKTDDAVKAIEDAQKEIENVTGKGKE